jgi:hypothetical protein
VLRISGIFLKNPPDSSDANVKAVLVDALFVSPDITDEIRACYRVPQVSG